MGKKLILIDGNSFCYRAYYAIRSLSNSKGQPTNAVYGFITMLNKLIKEEAPDYIAAAFDMKGPTFRHKRFEDYKVTRKPMPDDLISQMPLIKEAVAAYNISIFELQGYEADDILATITKEAVSRGMDTFIVTGDKDALQLVGPHVKILNTHKDGAVFDAEKVKEQFRVPPEKMVDLIALMGDSSDNIPGVTGIGEKTAVELIAEFGGFEELYRNLDRLKSASKRQLLEKYRQQALMSRELAVLDSGVPIKMDFEKMRLTEPDKEKLITLFRELEFKNLLGNSIERTRLDAEYTLVDTQEKFKKLVAALAGLDGFAFDVETTHSDPMQAALVGVSFCWKEAEAQYVDFRKEGLGVDYCLAKLRPILEDKKIKKIGQNIKYEKVVLLNYGIDLAGIWFDTMVASYLLNPSKLNHNLGDISLEYLNHKMMDITDLIGKGKSQITMAQVEINRVCGYCCEDSDVTLRLSHILEKELKKRNLFSLFEEVEVPLIEVLAKMEFAGVCVDSEYLLGISKKMDKELQALTKDIYEIAGSEFNINSPRQLQEILFVKLKLPPVKRTKTGISTDEEVLTKLALQHALPKAILEYRVLAKLKSTYVDALRELVNPKTGRIHTSFNQTVTSTGRLSSSDPNLQNIPVKTEAGRNIRKAFVPQDKRSYILSADYSQIELRILAHLSGDKTLTEAFKNGLDIHTYTAGLLSIQRSQAKTVNFGIVYGMSPYGLSKDLGIPVEEAQQFIEAYFARYPKVKEYIESCIAKAREEGFVTTLLNRRRYIPEINSQNMNMRGFAERTAANTPIQGSAADLIKLAMIEIQAQIEKRGLASRMIIQVHDELVFEAPAGELDVLRELVRDKMENVLKLSVPVKVDISAGKNWLELKGE